MINKIDLLHEGHCCDFARHTGEKAAGLLCMIPYHHEIVIELGEYCFDSFTELFASPGRRMPVLPIQPTRNLKSDTDRLKGILPNPGTETAFVSKHHAVVIFPAHILEVTDVMNACRNHVMGKYDTTYSADRMEFITVIMQALRGAIS